MTASTVVEGLLTGLAQVFFQGNAITGVVFAVGLLISSRVACVAALLGSFVGLLVAWGMGAAEPAIRAGAFGFNSVLTAITLGSGFYVLNVTSAAYGTLAVATAAVVFAAMSAALEPLGMPALTSPFVLVVWLFFLTGPLFQRLRTSLHYSRGFVTLRPFDTLTALSPVEGQAQGPEPSRGTKSRSRQGRRFDRLTVLS